MKELLIRVYKNLSWRVIIGYECGVQSGVVCATSELFDV